MLRSRVARPPQTIPRLLAAIALVLGARSRPGPRASSSISASTECIHEGIAKTLGQEIGAGRGDAATPASSLFIIQREPFRRSGAGVSSSSESSTQLEGQGPRVGDGIGDVGANLALGAGLADSCAGCHGRPRGAAGAGGDVVTAAPTAATRPICSGSG